MSAPPNVRVNIGAPFPSIVRGITPFAIAKLNGIWTLGLSLAGLNTQNPSVTQYPTDYVLVWDSVANIFFRVPLSAFPVAGRTQRSITAAGNLPITSADVVLNINSTSDLAPGVPLAVTRNGVPLTFKNLPGSHVQTLTASAPDTIEGGNIVHLASGQSVTIVPYNDGVNNALGYAIES